jgi:hypothetical protein
MKRTPAASSFCRCSVRFGTLRPKRSSFQAITQSKRCSAAACIILSNARRDRRVPETPSSTYSPAFFQPRRSMSSRRSRSWTSQCWSVVDTFAQGGHGFDALIFGYSDETGDLRFAAKTRNGFTPATRDALMKRMQPLVIKDCPFTGLHEKRPGRWGQGITAEKMKDCVWLTPKLVATFEFLEWTPDAVCASYCTSS